MRDEDVPGLDDDLERPILLQTKSDTNIFRNRGAMRRRSPPRGPITSGQNSGKATPPDSKPESPNVHPGKRHISFNTFVEQCVAVDDPADIPLATFGGLEEEDEDSDDDDDSEDMLEMRSSSFSSSSSRHSRPSLSRTSSSTSEHLTIAKIAPTMLKTTAGILPPNRPQMVYAPPPEYLSPPLSASSGSASVGSSSRGMGINIGTATTPVYDFPSPQVHTHGKWPGAGEDDDEYGSVGFDYFGGPDLAGSPKGPTQTTDNPNYRAQGQHQQQGSNTSSGTTSSNSTGTSTPTPAVVGQPPVQPKWRNLPGSTSEQSSNSSSTSSSSNNLPGGVFSPPQPSRGILKVRPPTTTPPNPEPASPPTSYFNYTPSAATGIGGMRGSMNNNHNSTEVPGPSGSPVNSMGPQSQVTEEVNIPISRGRSTSRDRTPAWERSSSRGSGAGSSVGSISPGGGGIGGRGSPNEGTAKGRVTAGGGLGRVVEGVVVGEEGKGEAGGGEYVPEKSETPTPHSSPQVS
jgi:hypothetical protein